MCYSLSPSGRYGENVKFMPWPRIEPQLFSPMNISTIEFRASINFLGVKANAIDTPPLYPLCLVV